MTARSRSALGFALALGVVSLAAPAAHAQDISLAPAPVTAPASAPAAAPAPVGPTMDAASVAVRHEATSSAAAAPRRGGYGQPVALMVVGGVAIVAGLIIGGGAGTAVAVAGLAAGVIGLYQYLQ
jgi:pyruvate dehydrogenase E2 component (dihydrolipoamide acetyltransferase)